jgi:hypothetical protein
MATAEVPWGGGVAEALGVEALGVDAVEDAEGVTEGDGEYSPEGDAVGVAPGDAPGVPEDDAEGTVAPAHPARVTATRATTAPRRMERSLIPTIAPLRPGMQRA